MECLGGWLCADGRKELLVVSDPWKSIHLEVGANRAARRQQMAADAGGEAPVRYLRRRLHLPLRRHVRRLCVLLPPHVPAHARGQRVWSAWVSTQANFNAGKFPLKNVIFGSRQNARWCATAPPTPNRTPPPPADPSFPW